MASLKVYFDLMSQPSRSVLLLLKANKVPFVPHLIKIAKGMHLTDEEFVDVNPVRKVPAIKDGNFNLSESTAIMRYICAKHQLPDHWYPADINKRAKIDEYLSWHHTNTRMAAVEIIWGKLFGPRMMGKPVDEKKIARGKEHMKKCMEIYENHFLKDSPFLSSEQITIADLLAVCEFSELDLLEQDFVEISEKVKDWQKRCKAQLGADYDDVHSMVYKMKAVLANL